MSFSACITAGIIKGFIKINTFPQIRVSDPVFLPGSGFQVSLEPDPDPVSDPGSGQYQTGPDSLPRLIQQKKYVHIFRAISFFLFFLSISLNYSLTFINPI